MRKADTSIAYLSGITSMFDFSYPDRPTTSSRTVSDIDNAAKKITEQSFSITGSAMKSAMQKHEKQN